MTENLPQYPKFLLKEIIDWVEQVYGYKGNIRFKEHVKQDIKLGSGYLVIVGKCVSIYSFHLYLGTI